MSVVQASQPIEYVEESTVADPETNPSMSWIGLVKNFSVVDGVEVVDTKTLSNNPSNTLGHRTNIKDYDSYGVSMTYVPQDLSFIQYVTGTEGDTSRSLTPVQFGQQNKGDGEYRRIMGCIGEEASISIQKDSVVEVSQNFLVMETTDWDDSDYIGTGSHATEDPSTPLKYEDLGNVSLNNTAIGDYISGITITIKNTLEVTRDVNSGLSTEITSVKPVDRAITVELDLVYDDMSVVDLLHDFDDNRLTFNLGDDVVEISNFQLAEVGQDLTRGALQGSAIPSTNASKFKWGNLANKRVTAEQVVGTVPVFHKDYHTLTVSEVISPSIGPGVGRYISVSESVAMPQVIDFLDLAILEEVVGGTASGVGGKIIGQSFSEVTGISESFITDFTQRGIVLSEAVTTRQIETGYAITSLDNSDGNSYWLEVEFDNSSGGGSPQLDSVTYDSEEEQLTTDHSLNSGKIFVTIYEDVGADGVGGNTDKSGRVYNNSETVELEEIQVQSNVSLKVSKSVAETVSTVEEIIQSILP